MTNFSQIHPSISRTRSECKISLSPDNQSIYVSHFPISRLKAIAIKSTNVETLIIFPTQITTIKTFFSHRAHAKRTGWLSGKRAETTRKRETCKREKFKMTLFGEWVWGVDIVGLDWRPATLGQRIITSSKGRKKLKGKSAADNNARPVFYKDAF